MKAVSNIVFTAHISGSHKIISVFAHRIHEECTRALSSWSVPRTSASSQARVYDLKICGKLKENNANSSQSSTCNRGSDKYLTAFQRNWPTCRCCTGALNIVLPTKTLNNYPDRSMPDWGVVYRLKEKSEFVPQDNKSRAQLTVCDHDPNKKRIGLRSRAIDVSKRCSLLPTRIFDCLSANVRDEGDQRRAAVCAWRNCVMAIKLRDFTLVWREMLRQTLRRARSSHLRTATRSGRRPRSDWTRDMIGKWWI